MSIELLDNEDYVNWLKTLKLAFRRSQLKAAVAVNSNLLEFYWDLGKDIISLQRQSSWGDSFLKQLSKDLTLEFPEMKGFSYRNLCFMRQWVQFYLELDSNSETACFTNSELAKSSDESKVKQLVSLLKLIPWGHHIAIIQKCDSPSVGLYYINSTIKNGWSRSVLQLQLKSQLHLREARLTHNFQDTLATIDSDLASQTLKDPYIFDFISLREGFQERELEVALIDQLEKFLLELGKGFAFVGRQYQLSVSDQDFYIDLLFYHLELRCFVVIDLKIGEFKAEFAGKMNFYCSAVDDLLAREGDKPTIGLILCRDKDKLIAEYSLRGLKNPIGVSEYQLTQSLPKELKSSLPSIEDIERELEEENE